jgi:coenzyme F420-0:L-glutamate ligase / coenzyme F420-1:gamma-L-glutamate ligase
MCKEEYFYTLVEKRRSIRRFHPDSVPEELLERLLRAASLAPSAHNNQPWRFVVLTKEPAKTRVRNAMLEKFRETLEAEKYNREEVEKQLEHAEEVFDRAPAGVIICMSVSDMQHHTDPNRSEGEYLMAVQSAALAGGQLLLAAQAEGLGACWVCSPLFTQKAVRQALDLPEDWEPQALIQLGFPDEMPGPRSLLSLEELVLWQ